MFTKAVFEDLIHPFTLTFKKPKLEKLYRNLIEEKHLQRFSPFHMMILSMIAIWVFGWIRVAAFYSTGSKKEFLLYLVNGVLLLIGIVLEIMVIWIKQYIHLRTIPLTFFVLLSGAVANGIEQRFPSIFPG